jgi:hypothetical protein
MPAKLPRITQRGAALTEADVAAVEQRLGVSFPDDYRAFLLQINGGVPRPGKWVKQIFSLGSDVPPDASFEVAYDNLKVRQERIPRRMIPVADDGGGNLYCISTTGTDRGVVYYWFHEDEDDEDAIGPDGRSDAAVKRFAPSFDALLEKEAKVKRKKIPAWLEMIEDGDLAGFTKWLSAGGKWNEPFEESGDYHTPLSAASRERHPAFVEAILDHGGNIDHAFYYGAGNPALARRLLARGVSKGVLSQLLASGVFFADLDFMRAVLDAGADPNHAERDGRGHWTPLHRAALEGSADAVRLLLERGARPGVWRDVDNELALHIAIRWKKLDVVKLLLDAGEDLYATPPEPNLSLKGGPAIDVLNKVDDPAFVEQVKAYATGARS